MERETGLAEERAKVAGVFVNRLNRGMRLQSDPTVIYGLMATSGSLGRPLTRKDLADKHAYNTYAHGGLPPDPSPILDALPSRRRSIRGYRRALFRGRWHGRPCLRPHIKRA